ncbi:TPA: hypothetical protein MX308_000459 [Klebsiella pneumoniae]|nr:hypothetical protein [Klebsiella pneumoniae]
MNIPQCGIKLHSGNFSAIGKILQEQLSDGKCLRLQVKEWVKRNLKKTYLGCEEVTYTDFITGEKTTTWEPRHTSDLDTAEMHIFLTKVEAWCAQFGLVLTIPQGCEYQQLQQKQEA